MPPLLPLKCTCGLCLELHVASIDEVLCTIQEQETCLKIRLYKIGSIHHYNYSVLCAIEPS